MLLYGWRAQDEFPGPCACPGPGAVVLMTCLSYMLIYFSSAVQKGDGFRQMHKSTQICLRGRSSLFFSVRTSRESYTHTTPPHLQRNTFTHRNSQEGGTKQCFFCFCVLLLVVCCLLFVEKKKSKETIM